MQDTARYQYLLGLQLPWTVRRVNLDVTGPRMDVWAEHLEDAAWTYFLNGRALVTVATPTAAPAADQPTTFFVPLALRSQPFLYHAP